MLGVVVGDDGDTEEAGVERQISAVVKKGMCVNRPVNKVGMKHRFRAPLIQPDFRTNGGVWGS